jgi:hypothetical protein
MAFSMISHFRKYQKFWMAAILLMCMLTFVLCTGTAGDFGARVEALFRSRHGAEAATLNGTTLYLKDLEDLRTRRNIADLYMRNAARFSVKRLDEGLLNMDKIPQQQRGGVTILWNEMKKDLTERLARPRFFSGGVKYDDLLNFMLWVQQADRLGIVLERESLAGLISQSIYGRAVGFDRNTSLLVQHQVRNSNFQATDDVIFNALRDEFRAQIAQICLMNARPDRLLEPPNPAYIYQYGGPFLNVSALPELRRPMSPEQLWDDYRKQCATFDVALVPVAVDDFLKTVREPKQAELEEFYAKYRDAEYNPTVDRPSFKFPPQMKVQWVSVNEEYYHKLSKAATTLEITPPIVWWSPLLPPSLGVTHYASQAAAWDASLEQNYENYKKKDPEKYLAPSLTNPAFLLELAGSLDHDKSSPPAAAAVVGLMPASPISSAGGLLNQVDRIYARHQQELASVLPALVKPRLQVAAATVLAGGASPLLAQQVLHAASADPEELQELAGRIHLPVSVWPEIARKSNGTQLSYQVQFLPLGLVRNELRDKLEKNLSEDWARKNMVEVRDKLTFELARGRDKAMERRLAEVKPRFGLKVKSTELFHNRYDIAKSPALKPLFDSFEKYRAQINQIEGRAGKAEMLKEDDFWRLFFDSSIGYSVANAGLYVPRPWPPDVRVKKADFGPITATVGDTQTVSLFKEANRPFLFWQTSFEPPRAPKSLDEVKDRVVRAWKEIQARDQLVLPRAQAIAEALQQAGPNVRPKLTEEAAKLGHEVIMLRGIAPLVAQPAAGEGRPRTYGPYELPKDTFVYPREDMVKELLQLKELNKDSKDAIKIGNKDGTDQNARNLDELNIRLLKRAAENKTPGTNEVQVLTNLPRSTYYVAVVVNAPEASRQLFVMNVYAGAAGPRNLWGASPDGFVEYSQTEAGKAYQQALLNQFREKYLVPNSEARNMFDREGS